MDAPFAGGLGEHAEQFAGQADVAPARGDGDGDVRGAVLSGWLVAGDRDTAVPGAIWAARRVASTPEAPGRLMSISTTSGAVS